MEHPGISIYKDFLAFWVDGGAWNALSCLCQAYQVLNQGSPEIPCLVNQRDNARPVGPLVEHTQLSKALLAYIRIDINQLIWTKRSSLLSMSLKHWHYTIMIIHWLLIYASMKHSLLYLKLLALALNSLDTLSDIRIKAVYASLLIQMLSIPNPSLACLVLLHLL